MGMAICKALFQRMTNEIDWKKKSIHIDDAITYIFVSDDDEIYEVDAYKLGGWTFWKMIEPDPSRGTEIEISMETFLSENEID